MITVRWAPAVAGAFVLLTLAAGAAAGQPSYRRTLTITRNTGTPLTDVQVPVVLTPENFDYGHLDPAGALVRFRDASGAVDLAYYRETWSPGGTSVFWVRVPTVPGFGTTELRMHYGRPADAAPSSFAATFPNAFRLTSGTAALVGTHAYDWFEVAPGATLRLTPATTPLVVSARRILVAGTIDGKGLGHLQGVYAYDPGAGPGGGEAADQHGGGGGGYGRPGGNGGALHYQDPPNGGGPQYGTYGEPDIDLGSSGGGGDTFNSGGAGGGSLTLRAQRLDVSGTLDLRGNDALGGFSNGGGGGSGGGVLLRAYEMSVTGSVTASGGTGRTATWYGGGGGAGGRIKLFYEAASNLVGSIAVAGGAGGPATGDPDWTIDGAPGGAGTTCYAPLTDFDEVTAVVGSEETVVSVEPGASRVRVSEATPNPARSRATLRLELDQRSALRADIVDLQGRRVRSLARGQDRDAGLHDLVWDLADERGVRVPAGLYLANVRVDQRTWSRRIVVVE